MANEQQVLDVLRNIMDPDLGRDVVSLGFVKNLRIDGGVVAFDLELTTPACPMRERFKKQAEELVGALPGVERVDVNLTAMARPHRHGPEQQQQPQVNTLDGVQSIVAVSSCKGGVGKSTVAAHLALALKAEGLRVGLLDADIYGPSFPTLFNIHRPDVFMQDNRIVPIEQDGIKIMSFGFLLGDSPAVLRGPIVSSYIQQLLTQTNWGDLDYLIIDMPPGTGDIQLTITQSAELDGALIVTTPQTLSLVDVAKGILMFEKVEVPVLGIIENMSYFKCDGCDKEHRIFGSGANGLGERFGLEILAELPIIPGISQLDGEAAKQVAEPMAHLARNLHRAVGRRRIETIRPTVIVEEHGLRIQWPSGEEKQYGREQLRAICRCAQCVDEFTGERFDIAPEIIAEARIEEAQPLGNYAVAVTWDDRHHSIYPWQDLP